VQDTNATDEQIDPEMQLGGYGWAGEAKESVRCGANVPLKLKFLIQKELPLWVTFDLPMKTSQIQDLVKAK